MTRKTLELCHVNFKRPDLDDYSNLLYNNRFTWEKHWYIVEGVHELRKTAGLQMLQKIKDLIGQVSQVASQVAAQKIDESARGGQETASDANPSV